MKLLVATRETQGDRKNDFCWCNEGEVVTFAMECDGGSVDDSCGCRRSMGGLDTHTSTTTMMVVDRGDIDPPVLVEKMLDSLEAAGWISERMPRSEWEANVRADAEWIARFCEGLPVGTIVEKRGRNMQTRRIGKE